MKQPVIIKYVIMKKAVIKLVRLAIIAAGAFVFQTDFAAIVTTTNYSATSFTAFPASAADLIENGSIYRLSSTISGPNAFNNNDAQNLMTDGTVQRFAAWYPNATVANPTIVTFQFDLTRGAAGYDITNITSIAAYDSGGMYINQNFDVYLSYVSSPSTFVLLDSVSYSPLSSNLPGSGSSQVTLTDSTGTLATGVAAIQFQFKSNGANGQIIGEMDVFGTPKGGVQNNPVKIVDCIGDSITEGFNLANISDVWPNQLQGMLGGNFKVLNFGVTSKTLMKEGDQPYVYTVQYTNSLLASPDIVIIMLGSNDSKPQNWIYGTNFVGDYEAMISSYTNLPSHPTVFLNTCPTAYGTYAGITDPIVTGQIVPLIWQVGQNTGCAVFDVNSATANMPQNFPDTVHPNAAGDTVIAKTVFNGLLNQFVLDRSGWVASASVGNSASNALDGNLTTQWTTGVLQANGQWFQVDMQTTNLVAKIVMDAGGSTNDYPRGYQVNVSNDGTNWGSPVATGAGNSAVTTITFPTQTARYIRVTETGTTTTNFWNINEFTVYGMVLLAPPAPTELSTVTGDGQIILNWVAAPRATSYNVRSSTNSGGPYVLIGTNVTGLFYSPSYTNAGLANGTTYYYVVSAVNAVGESTNSAQVSALPGALLSRVGWIASASSTESGGSAANAIDGNINTRWATGASQSSGQWFEVDMGATNTFNKLVLDAGSSTGDYPRGYQVNVSNDGINWGSPVASGAGTSAVTAISFATQTARYIRVTQTSTGSTGNWWSIAEFYVYGPSAPTGPIVLNASAVSGGGITLSWTNSATELYSTPSLTLPVVWTLVTNAPVFSNGQWTLTLPSNNSQGFFRLKQ